MTIPKGITREHVLKVLADLQEGRATLPEREPKAAGEVRYNGTPYPTRALLLLALTGLLGQPPNREQQKFTTGDANQALRGLGFDVQELAAADPWDAFIAWGRKLWEHPKFQEVERDSKLRVVESMRAVKVCSRPTPASGASSYWACQCRRTSCWIGRVRQAPEVVAKPLR